MYSCFRWACHGLDFLSVACELRVLVTLTDEQFEVSWNILFM